jgi:hypothetical protein
MQNPTRTGLVELEAIMELLTDLEVAAVSTAETRPHLDEGDEFVDLQHLDQGVLRADGVKVHMGDVLPRKAVDARTWTQVVALLAVNSGTPTSA